VKQKAPKVYVLVEIGVVIMEGSIEVMLVGVS
jgi:hypothetical protein